MRTQEKLARFKSALEGWKANKAKNPIVDYQEPQPSEYHIISPAELHVARSIREKIVGRGA